jgi:hypothetical protein
VDMSGRNVSVRVKLRRAEIFRQANDIIHVIAFLRCDDALFISEIIKSPQSRFLRLYAEEHDRVIAHIL